MVRRTRSLNRRDEGELNAGGGPPADPPADPPAGQQHGEVAVVQQPVDNPMLAMVRDMLRAEREENMRRMESMLEPFRRQQQQPGQLSYRQQLQLQLEREQRELQLRYE